MRYAYTKISENVTVIYDKQYQKTLLISGNVSDEIIKEYEDTIQTSKVEKLNVTTFVLNTTQECNLRCKYCSRYHGNYSSECMDVRLMREIIDWIYRYAVAIHERCVIQFHGGEPTLRWKSIREALSQFDKDDICQYLDLRIQTNGTNLPDELLDFCNQYDIHIGVSVDGPAEITNIVRKFENGEGIAEILEKNIKKIQNKSNRKNVSCLCVITQNSIGKADKIFKYILKNHIDDISILPLYNDYSCINDDRSIIPRNSEMARFSIEIIDLWVNELLEGHEICMPNFQIWVWNLLSSNSDVVFECSSCCGAGETMAFIDMNGDVYPCGPFSYYEETKIGNLLTLEIDEHNISKTVSALQPFSKRNVPECDNCGIQAICKKGCIANSYLYFKDISKKDPYCEYWKIVISHILLRISENPELINIIPDYTLRL